MLGGVYEEVSIVPIVYPRGTVSISPLGSFFLLVLLLKLLVLLLLSLSEHTTFNSNSRRTGGRNENIFSHRNIRLGMRSG